jgi:hypothetical protein
VASEDGAEKVAESSKEDIDEEYVIASQLHLKTMIITFTKMLR